jgi:hypothetical protein
MKAALEDNDNNKVRVALKKKTLEHDWEHVMMINFCNNKLL